MIIIILTNICWYVHDDECSVDPTTTGMDYGVHCRLHCCCSFLFISFRGHHSCSEWSPAMALIAELRRRLALRLHTGWLVGVWKIERKSGVASVSQNWGGGGVTKPHFWTIWDRVNHRWWRCVDIWIGASSTFFWLTPLNRHSKLLNIHPVIGKVMVMMAPVVIQVWCDMLYRLSSAVVVLVLTEI